MLLSNSKESPAFRRGSLNISQIEVQFVTHSGIRFPQSGCVRSAQLDA